MNQAEEILRTLSPEKKALLEILLEKKRNNGGSYPLSSSQQRMWFMQKLEPESALYNIPAATLVQGPIEPAILEKCFKQLLKRHSALQCIFPASGDSAICVKREYESFKLKTVDLRNSDLSDRIAHAVAMIESDCRIAFDISTDLLIKVSLFIISENESVVFILMHHIISDGWSMQILIKELAALYDAEISGTPSPLVPLVIDYNDYVRWQLQWNDSPGKQKQRDYWISKLNGLKEKILLTDKTYFGHANTGAGRHFSFKLSEKYRHGLKTLSVNENTTMFMTSLTLFKILLMRFSGCKDITIGTPVANRSITGSQGLVGLFVNTVLLRDDLSSNPSFRSLLRKVKSTVIEAYANQEYPYDELVREFNPGRSNMDSGLFNIMFIYQNRTEDPAIENGKIVLKPLDLENGLSAFDLTFSISELNDGLLITAEYSTAVLTESFCRRLINSFMVLSESVMEDSSRNINSLPVVSEAERLSYYCSPCSAVPYAETMTTRIREHSIKAGANTAVVERAERYSYNDLEDESGRVANSLIKAGAGIEDKTGISLSRSFRLIAGLTGILKAGSIYVPLDPNYPSERLKYMIEDSGIKVLITEEKYRETFSELFHGKVINMDSDEYKSETCCCPVVNIDPDNGAYIIYTSGSTGKPKGVLVSHGSAVNHNKFIKTLFDLSSADRVMQFSTINFDAAVEEIFPALQNGASLILRKTELLPSGSELLDQIREEQITILDLPTSYWQEWVRELYEEYENVNIPPSLRLVAIGGESVSPERVKQWKEITNGRIRLINTYGPTESAIISSWYETDGWEANIPIGKPVDNTLLYVMDTTLNLLPPHVSGELMIGGMGLARGYAGKPEQTAEKFVPDPFSKFPGRRMYRSGDLARLRDDGNFEYIARKDGQIKLRGFRIETREIERAIENLPRVTRALVILDTRNELKRLSAFYTTDDNTEIKDPKEILKKVLPDYMIPAFFFRLDSFPLALNGKIDISALREIDPSAPGVSAIPKNNVMSDTEFHLSEIWKDLLGVNLVASEDDFFDLGGHSLLLTRLVFRINKLFNVDFPLREAFDNSKLQHMAASIDKLKQSVRKDLCQLTINKTDTRTLSYSQVRLWALDQIDKLNSVYNIPSVFHIRGCINFNFLEKSINIIASRHQVLRSNIVTIGGKPELVINDSLNLRLHICSEFKNAGQDTAAFMRDYVINEARKPFNIASEPLIRAIVIEKTEDECLLILNIHHLIFDGWSSGIFLNELVEIYRSLVDKRNPMLPELNIQYSDYAVWQRDYLQGNILNDSLSYWKRKLAGITGNLELPFDYPLPEMLNSDGLHETIIIENEIFDSVRNACRQYDVTEFSYLLAVFNILLQKYTGQNDICIGTPSANRTIPETDNLIGLFVNTIVLRTVIDNNMTLPDLLKQVKNTVVEAYLNQQLPFEKLVEELNPPRRTNRNPIFQVMFIYNEGEKKAAAVNDILQVSAYNFENGISMFDLSLILEKTPDGLIAALEYNTSLFKQSTALDILYFYKILLLGIAHNTSERLSDLPDFQEKRKAHEAEIEGKDASGIKGLSFRQVIENTENENLRCNDKNKCKILEEVWREILHISNFSYNDNFFELGGDSILAIQMVSRARTAGLKIEVIDIFKYQTISRLAACAAFLSGSKAEQGIITGQSRLTPIQQWFFEQNFEYPSHWNQSVLIELKEKLSTDLLKIIIKLILQHHDVLRSRFYFDQNGWIQITEMIDEEIPFEIINAEIELSAEEVLSHHTSRIQASLNLEKGPVIRFAYFRMNDKQNDFLLIAAHHLVIDAVSWSVLLEDIHSLFRQLKSGQPIQLPLKTTSYIKWAEELLNTAQTDKIKNEAAYWLSLPFEKVHDIETDLISDGTFESDSINITSSLGREAAEKLLHEIPFKGKLSVMDMLLTALTRSYSAWCGKRTMSVDLEGHGRVSLNPDTDVSRTCGWFTSVYPAVFDLEDSIYIEDSLETISRQFNSIPNDGFNYGLLKYLCDDPVIKSKMAEIPRPQICFNYLGQLNEDKEDSQIIAGNASGPKGIERSLENHLTHLLDINAVINNHELQVQWSFSPKVFYESTVLHLASMFIDELEKIITYCTNPVPGEPASGSFKMVNLTKKELNGILDKVKYKKQQG